MYSLYTFNSNNDGFFTNSWTNNVHNLLRELMYWYEYCQSPRPKPYNTTHPWPVYSNFVLRSRSNT